MTDEEIQKNVLDELKWDARLRPTEIGVTVKDGVVTLVGNVDSYMKKWEAEDAVLRVRGVRAVANELDVKLGKSDERSDEDIARAAKEALEDALDVPPTVRVAVDGGWITLRGEVEWQFQKQAAERKVRHVKGVRGVINAIEVKPIAKPEDLKRKIEDALVRAAETDAKRIQVEVQDGRVILKGKVHSWYEKEEAKREAWLAPGVRDVVDELRISFD
ncbi:MAG: transport-associated protein [bacterium]|nr:transport-associated protein [bacterium]